MSPEFVDRLLGHARAGLYARYAKRPDLDALRAAIAKLGYSMSAMRR